VSPHSLEAPAPAVGLSHSSGARAAVYPDGAQLFTWWPSQESEVLFVSDRVERRPGKSFHGGVPIVFPQFASEGPLPQHGFARAMRWEMLPRDTMTLVALRLGDGPRTRALWPHAFEAEYAVTLDDRSLAMQLTVTNRGESRMSFTCALHTYLRVGEVSQVELSGLAGCRYRDKVLGSEETQEQETLTIPGPVDRVYLDVPGPVSLLDPAIGRTIDVLSDGFADVVVWNPGEEGTLAFGDLAPDDWRHFLCVEAACVGRAVELEPSQVWTGRQVLRV
jgi:glucose-6-phosphate 1-epimerase